MRRKLGRECGAVSSRAGLLIILTSMFIMSSITMTIILNTSLASTEERPNAQFSFHYSDHKVIINYDKGQAISSEEISVESMESIKVVKSDWDNGVVTAKDEVVLRKTGADKWNEESITVIWNSNDSDSTAILAQDEAPKLAY